MILSKLAEYMHFKNIRRSIILNVDWRKWLPPRTPSKLGRSATQSKASSPLTCTSTYFPQVYQITTPWQDPIGIINVLESLNLILEAVVVKAVGITEDAEEDTEEDVEEEVEVDVSEEENAANMTPTPEQANMDPLL